MNNYVSVPMNLFALFLLQRYEIILELPNFFNNLMLFSGKNLQIRISVQFFVEIVETHGCLVTSDNEFHPGACDGNIHTA